MICKACGKEIPDQAKFCRYCGEKFAVSEPRKAKQSAAPSPSRKKSKAKKKRRSPLGVLLLLALAVLVGVKLIRGRGEEGVKDDFIMSDVGVAPAGEDAFNAALSREPDFTGLSSLCFDSSVPLSTETVTVGGEVWDYALPSGVTVSFDPYTLSGSEHSLTVSALGEGSDGEYRCVAYDLLLDGQGAELAGLASVSLPYDPAWGENVFVQYYNEESGRWEILYTETDGSGNARFYTDHFCTFAVFCSMVTGNSSSDEAGKVFRIFGDDPLSQKVWVDYAALSACLREQSPSTVKDTSSQSTAYFVVKGLDTVGFYTSAADLGIREADTAALLLGGIDKVSGFARSASDTLGHFGAVITMSKLMTEVYRRGDSVDYYELLRDNQSELASLALYAGGTLGAGSVATFCNAAGIMLFVYSASDAAITSIDLKGSGDVPEYAYREFSSRYIVYNQKTGVCSVRYTPDAFAEASTCYADTLNDIDLPCREAAEYADWKDFFDAISTLKPDVIPEKIDNVLTQYTSVFWNLPKTEPDTLSAFLQNTRSGILGSGTLAEEYSRPDDYKIREYKASFKSDLYRWLRPYMQECLRRSYYAMLNDAFREAAELQEQFNSTLRFTLEDPNAESFERSPYAQYALTLSGSSSGDIGYEATVNGRSDVWHFSREEGYSISCSYLSYLLYGTPKYLRIRSGEKDVQTLEITPCSPETVITLGSAAPEETGDYVWTLTDVWYGDRSAPNQFPLRMYAIYNNGNNILTPFDYAYEIVFDEAQLGFRAYLRSYSLSSSTLTVSSPGRLVRRAADFVFRGSTSDFAVDTTTYEAWEASAPYFEVMVQNSADGSVYYLTDGSRAQIPGGALSAETISDGFYDSSMRLSGELLIPDAEEETAGQKVLFDTFGVCYLYTVLPMSEAESRTTQIHHGDMWAISQAEKALD